MKTVPKLTFQQRVDDHLEDLKAAYRARELFTKWVADIERPEPEPPQPPRSPNGAIVPPKLAADLAHSKS